MANRFTAPPEWARLSGGDLSDVGFTYAALAIDSATAEERAYYSAVSAAARAELRARGVYGHHRSSDRHDPEFSGVYGRAVVRFGGSFHSVVWRAVDGEVGAKLYPAYEPLSDEAAFTAAQRFIHEGLRPGEEDLPGEGSRSFRTPTQTNWPAVSP